VGDSSFCGVAGEHCANPSSYRRWCTIQHAASYFSRDATNLRHVIWWLISFQHFLYVNLQSIILKGKSHLILLWVHDRFWIEKARDWMEMYVLNYAGEPVCALPPRSLLPLPLKTNYYYLHPLSFPFPVVAVDQEDCRCPSKLLRRSLLWKAEVSPTVLLILVYVDFSMMLTPPRHVM